MLFCVASVVLFSLVRFVRLVVIIIKLILLVHILLVVFVVEIIIFWVSTVTVTVTVAFTVTVTVVATADHVVVCVWIDGTTMNEILVQSNSRSTESSSGHNTTSFSLCFFYFFWDTNGRMLGITGFQQFTFLGPCHT